MGLGDWLISEAGAGWFFGGMSIAGLAYRYLRRVPPGTVVVRDVAHTTLVRVRPAVREIIEITFNGAIVPHLAQLDLEISNSGSNVVADAEIAVRFPETTRILDAGNSDPLSQPMCSFRIAQNALTLRVPYVNPYREHHHRILISIVTDGDTQITSVLGSGAGWSTRHAPIPSARALSRRVNRLLVGLGAWAAIGGGITYSVGLANGIGPDEFSLRAAGLVLPFVCGAIYLFVVLQRTMRMWSQRAE